MVQNVRAYFICTLRYQNQIDNVCAGKIELSGMSQKLMSSLAELSGDLSLPRKIQQQ